MKKIHLSKETLRVLTTQEVAGVAGGGTGTTPNSIDFCEERPTVRRCTANCPTGNCTSVQTAPDATCQQVQTKFGVPCVVQPMTRTNPVCQGNIP